MRSAAQRCGSRKAPALPGRKNATTSLMQNEKSKMNVIYRAARKEDSYRIAELDYIASGGASEYLFHNLVPNSTPIQIIAYGLDKDYHPNSYRNVIVAETNNEIIGMSLSFPAHHHQITKEMRSFFPPKRLEHFKEFFSARVDDSYLVDAICVDEKYRNRGIGCALLKKTFEKAHNEGFSMLSLIVFADNHNAIKFYEGHGFATVRKINLREHSLIPHKGGCLLMKAKFI